MSRAGDRFEKLLAEIVGGWPAAYIIQIDGDAIHRWTVTLYHRDWNDPDQPCREVGHWHVDSLQDGFTAALALANERREELEAAS